MSIQTLGDLAQTFVTRRQNTELKMQMTSLTQELASGRTADINRHLKGSFAQIADIEHRLHIQASYRTTTAEAGIFTSAMQVALERVQVEAEDIGAVAILTGATTGGTAIASVASRAQNGLDVIVSALNTEIAGRPLFSGVDLDESPLIDSGSLLSLVRTALAGTTNANEVRAELDQFFANGGDFDALVYKGSAQNPAPYRLGEGESVQLSLKADDQAFRETLKFSVMAAVSNDDTLGLQTDDRLILTRTAGEGLMTHADRITQVRADLGFAESRIEQSSTRIAAEMTSLEYARGRLLAVDPFEAATELENVQFQLETLYTITARASRLNLVNYLS